MKWKLLMLKNGFKALYHHAKHGINFAWWYWREIFSSEKNATRSRADLVCSYKIDTPRGPLYF